MGSEDEFVTLMRNYLSKELPEYMIPRYFIRLMVLPLTTNGKIDLKALPKPDDTAIRKEYLAPATLLEEDLAKIWSELLGIESIGVTENFFDLGGHSLKATALLGQIYKIFKINLPLKEIYENPTIRGIAHHIEHQTIEHISLSVDNQLILLKKSKINAPHFFFIHDGSGTVEGYMDFCNHLQAEYNYLGICASENLTDESVETLAAQYIQKLKKIQPDGPYHLAGWSLGGVIAFEMVKQLEEREEKIAFLALFDSAAYHPRWAKEARKITQPLQRAQVLYQPAKQIKVKVYYFKAAQNVFTNPKEWEPYCSNLLEACVVDGDHFSIFKQPQVKEFAEKFDLYLKNK